MRKKYEITITYGTNTHILQFSTPQRARAEIEYKKLQGFKPVEYITEIRGIKIRKSVKVIRIW